MEDAIERLSVMVEEQKLVIARLKKIKEDRLEADKKIMDERANAAMSQIATGCALAMGKAVARGKTETSILIEQSGLEAERHRKELANILEKSGYICEESEQFRKGYIVRSNSVSELVNIGYLRQLGITCPDLKYIHYNIGIAYTK